MIVGGGIAGLSAAWRLHKRGFHDFVLLEMNDSAGGNARSGENEIERVSVGGRIMFRFLDRRPSMCASCSKISACCKNGVWDERYLCFAPQERLFTYGKWQDGIEPAIGLTRADREQFAKLEQLFNAAPRERSVHHSNGIGAYGEVGGSGRISFADWLRQNAIDSPQVLWYMNYCCRDDYGALAADTSAWAGIHYFASREAEEKGPITWPEGNGWITKRLLQTVGALRPRESTGTPHYASTKRNTWSRPPTHSSYAMP